MSFGGTFEEMMVQYCNFLSLHSDYKDKLEWLPQIPLEIKTYYNTIGPDALRSMSYKEANIKQHLGYVDQLDSIKAAVASAFVKGKFYTLKQAKEMIQHIYDNLGAAKRAKATDLEALVGCSSAKQTLDGHRVNGYVIL